MDKYFENGKQIYEEYCSTADNKPTMLPRAPDQTYIDIYPDEDQPGPSFRDEKRHQSDYETEVKVYRALEEVDGNPIVLHSFKFTHHQYRLCAGESHNPKGCLKCKGKNAGNQEGECDFLIICADSFIIMEVKNMENVGEVVECEPDFHLCSIGEDWQPECNREQQLKALNGTFQKSVKQRNKIVELIQCMDKNAKILQFTAYPNFSKQFKDEFQCSEKTELRLSDDELSTIICEEDLCRNELVDLKKSANHTVTIESTSLTEQSYLQENWFSRLVNCFSRCCKKDAVTDDTSSELTLPNSDTELSNSDSDSNRKILRSDENVSTFVAMWAANGTQADIPSPDFHEKAKNILLAIWATERDTCDKSKCSLGRCIVDINKQLKEGLITFEPKKGKKRKRDQNPGVVKAPDVISNYIGVRNLTTQQKSVFNSSENLLWINGPAGAGKTVILCGKILQLLESDSDNQVVVFKFTGDGNNSQHYQSALDNAKMKYKLISTSEYKHTPAQLDTLITESLCSAVIVEIKDSTDITYLTDRLSLLSGYHLFVDDIQRVIDSSSTTKKWTVFINKLLKFSADKNVWIACDFAQAWFVTDTRHIVTVANVIIDILKPIQRATLSRNLRNTFDLSSILSVIRNQFVKSLSLKSNILDLVLPTQSPGHFIHGPLTVMHVFNDFNVVDIVGVFNIELDRLCDVHDIGIVYNDFTSSSNDVMSLVKDSVNMRCDNTDSKIAVCSSEDCYSAQWPAVIVVYRVWGFSAEEELTDLYLMLSRARVYCFVFIYPEESRTLDNTPHMLPLLGKLSNFTRIIRY